MFRNTEFFFVQILSLEKESDPQTLQKHSFAWKYHSQQAPSFLASVLQCAKHSNQPSTKDMLNCKYLMNNNTDLGGKEERSTPL